jgi:hypothetical protein
LEVIVARNDEMSVEEVARRLKSHGAGHGLFSSPPPRLSDDSFTALMLTPAATDGVEDIPARARRRAGPPVWFAPMMAMMVPAFLGMAAVTFYSPAKASAARARVHTTHPMARRGVYVELDEIDDLEFYETVPSGPPHGRADGLRATNAKSSVSAASRGSNRVDLGALGLGAGAAIHEPVLSPAQASAAKREASFIDLTRNVRRSCRGAADAFPTSVQVRAHIVVGKSGAASEVRVEGNAPAVAACIERESRAYVFPAEAALSTIEVPFSWRKQ